MKTLTIYRLANRFVVDYYDRQNECEFTVGYPFDECDKLLVDIQKHVGKCAKISYSTITKNEEQK